MPTLNIDLPKWPAMTVLGKDITEDEAAEVLIRTNGWFYGSNDHGWEETAHRLFGSPMTIREGSQYPALDYEAVKKAMEAHRCINLGYLHNSRIMSSWVGGPHGWCNWNGTIRTTNYNIGKWPSHTEVLREWKEIAAAFPFLDLRCQLWAKETGEEGNEPLVEYRVLKGKVTSRVPRTRLLAPTFNADEDFAAVLGRRNERGCDEATLRRAIEVTRERLAGGPPSFWSRL